MTLLFIIGVSTYFLLMSLIGLLASRRIKTMDDYLVAGRKLPFFLAVPTIVATWFGAGSSMGVSGTVYAEGFYGVISDPFGCSLALMITGIFYAAAFRRLKLLTLSDLLRKAYGPSFERVSTFLMLPFYIGTLASQLVAMGYIFQVVSGLNFELGVVLGALIFVTYTISGGMWAVTLTDFVQFFLLLIGLIILLPICFEQTSDHDLLFKTFFHEFSTLIPKDNSSLKWSSYMGRIFLTALGAIMGQDLIQRILAARSTSTARKSALASGGLYFLLGLIPLFIGIAGRYIYPSLEKPELLIPLLAKEFLSPLAFTLFACGLFSAIMSTADSYLLAGTALFTNNILLKKWPLTTEKAKISLLRWVNLLIAALALVLSLNCQSIFNLMVHSGATLFVALFIPTTAALFLKKNHVEAAWTGLGSGILAWACFLIFLKGSYRPEDVLFSAALYGAIFSFISFVMVLTIKKMLSDSTTLKNFS